MRAFIFVYLVLTGLALAGAADEDENVVKEVDITRLPQIRIVTKTDCVLLGTLDGISACDQTDGRKASIARALVGSRIIGEQKGGTQLLLAFSGRSNEEDNMNEFLVPPFYDKKWYVNLYLIQKGWVGFGPCERNDVKMYKDAHTTLQTMFNELDKNILVLNSTASSDESVENALLHCRRLGLHSKKAIPAILQKMEEPVWRRVSIKALGFIGGEARSVVPQLLKYRDREPEAVFSALARYGQEAKIAAGELVEDLKVESSDIPRVEGILRVLGLVGKLDDGHLQTLRRLSENEHLNDNFRRHIGVFIKEYAEKVLSSQGKKD